MCRWCWPATKRRELEFSPPDSIFAYLNARVAVLTPSCGAPRRVQVCARTGTPLARSRDNESTRPMDLCISASCLRSSRRRNFEPLPRQCIATATEPLSTEHPVQTDMGQTSKQSKGSPAVESFGSAKTVKGFRAASAVLTIPRCSPPANIFLVKRVACADDP